MHPSSCSVRSRATLTFTRIATAGVLVLLGAIPVSAAGLDPCKLLTAADAKMVLELAVGAPDTNGAACTYSPSGGEGPTLTIIAGRYGSKGANAASFAKAREETQKASPDLATIADLGDAAYSAGSGHFVVFIQGEVSVSLMVSAPGSAKDFKARLVTAARLAAGRL